MNYKLTISIISVQMIVHIATQKPIVGNIYDDLEFDCNLVLSSMASMESRKNLHCVQFVLGYELPVECIKRIIENNENVTLYIRSLTWLLHRNVYVDESTSNINSKQSTKQCDNYLIVLKDVNSMESVLESMNYNASVATFLPYTKLFFMFSEKEVQFMPTRSLAKISKFFYENAQFGYAFEFNANRSALRLRDFLSLDRAISSNLIHPIVNRSNEEKHFRISFHNCYPFIIYVDEENMSFDGIEHHLMKIVTKNWKIHYILRDESKTGLSPWVTMFNDLRNKSADLAMCSVWVTDMTRDFDTSTYYSHECDTLLIPKPKLLSQITAIYRTLSGEVWITFFSCFLGIGILLWSSPMVDAKRTVYVSISDTLLDVMNIATSHGVNSFWKQQSATQILLLSWIFVSFLVGIGYTTIYTSRLTKPGYEKLINTVEDFIESDMFWGSQHPYKFLSWLNLSTNAAYRQLIDRIVLFRSRDDAEVGLASGKFGVFCGISNIKYLFPYDRNEELSALSSFRLMKQVCISNYYTSFALQKFSPYTELFSNFCLLFREHGITEFWFKTVYRDKKEYNTFFEDYPKESNEPVALRFDCIRGALLVLFVSQILSLIIFICEVAVKHFKS